MQCQFKEDDFRAAILDIVSHKDGQAIIIQVIGGNTLTGFAPLSVGRDYLRCQVAAGTGQKEQVVPFHSITCVR
ncbi:MULTISPECIES: hypothetical protein [Xanthobacter]|uniref:Uncharacterized protein n=2 Tax=Xanthobacter TaxID=279 RepID=A7IKG0_XANP2|nr:hypothetical protein [Xanthobacter oligotrophicus]ABS68503.1 hypothetical protein Xaut_3274 [Xanthobacter autotrophicus Py2]MCG5235866.1 hypothetical protein [Xanthobacter oligotrophicus]